MRPVRRCTPSYRKSIIVRLSYADSVSTTSISYDILRYADHHVRCSKAAGHDDSSAVQVACMQVVQRTHTSASDGHTNVAEAFRLCVALTAAMMFVYIYENPKQADEALGEHGSASS